MLATELISITVTIIGAIAASISSLIFKQKTDQKISQDDMKAAKEAAEVSRVQLQGGNKDVISLMINNVSELREYYVISKRQANRAFSSTLLVCILGFLIFVAGIVASALTGQNLAIYTTISGSIVEVIAGLFFWLYKNTTSQLNLYHERLGSTEKYLTVMQLTEKMSPEKKDETYRYIIEAILSNDAINIRSNKETKE